MSSQSSTFDLRVLLEQHCALSCNPSSLQQRLVMGGRNSAKYEAKMLQHKKNCLMGCHFARQSDIMARPEDKARVADLMKDIRQDTSTILDATEMREKRHKIEDWFIMMRLQCSKRCENACESRGTDAYKCVRSCAVGCDKFFDTVFSD